MTTEREMLAAFMLDARMGLAADKPSPYGEMADRLSGAVLTSDWLAAHTAATAKAAVEAAAVRVEAMRTAPPRDTFALMIRVPAAFVERAWACWNLGVVDAARAVRGDS